MSAGYALYTLNGLLTMPEITPSNKPNVAESSGSGFPSLGKRERYKKWSVKRIIHVIKKIYQRYTMRFYFRSLISQRKVSTASPVPDKVERYKNERCLEVVKLISCLCLGNTKDAIKALYAYRQGVVKEFTFRNAELLAEESAATAVKDIERLDIPPELLTLINKKVNSIESFRCALASIARRDDLMSVLSHSATNCVVSSQYLLQELINLTGVEPCIKEKKVASIKKVASQRLLGMKTSGEAAFERCFMSLIHANTKDLLLDSERLFNEFKRQAKAFGTPSDDLTVITNMQAFIRYLNLPESNEDKFYYGTQSGDSKIPKLIACLEELKAGSKEGGRQAKALRVTLALCDTLCTRMGRGNSAAALSDTLGAKPDARWVKELEKSLNSKRSIFSAV